MESRPAKKTRMEEYFGISYKVKAYGEDIFSTANIEATRVLAFNLLSESRIRQGIKDDEDYLFMRKNSSNLPNFRESLTYNDTHKENGSVKLYEIPWEDFTGHSQPQEVIFLWKQFDGTSCAGAVLLTCTAGFTKIERSRIHMMNNQINVETNPWTVEKEEKDERTGIVTKVRDYENLLTVEGMARLIYDAVGILPCIFFGKVAQETSDGQFEKLEDDDNMFQDDRFQILMRMVRFASICTWNGAHCYSVVCIPIGPDLEDSVYIVFDSMNHREQNLYQNYRSFRRHFLLEHTRPSASYDCAQRKIVEDRTVCLYPLTVTVYPVLQTQPDADPKLALFMQKLIHAAMKDMEDDCQPFVAWKTIAKILDEAK